MPDHKQPFDKRISNNTSENNFEELCHYRDILFYKYGIDNHPFGKALYKVNRKIRNTPDYIVVRDVAYFIEVKGCKNFVRMKLKDLESYDFWNKLMELYYCIYSATFRETRFISHTTLKNLVKRCNIKQFNDPTPDDKKEYYEIPFKEL
tara:strand:+ start:258 stop:704 length:447 start_codon:yes stop_codon:yes gene_type:complete